MAEHRHDRLFPSAGEDIESAREARESPQTRSPSYRLAYADTDFLVRDELRGVRLQLELMKPELMLQEHQIQSTIVVFGSARIPAPEDAETFAAATPEEPTDDDDPHRSVRVVAVRKLADKSRYYQEAQKFAALASSTSAAHNHQQYVVITGGGGGIMEAANRGAAEAGSHNIGLNIVLPFEQRPNQYITPSLSFQFHYFAIRKMHFLMRAKALTIFPGGFGTLDELFDALTLIQTGKIRPMPVLLFGREYWERVISFDVMVEEGVISPEDAELVTYVETAEEAWRAITAFYESDGAPRA